MYKTIEQWFNTLSEPVRAQALTNAAGRLHYKEPLILDAFKNGFNWSETPEGLEYWQGVYKQEFDKVFV